MAVALDLRRYQEYKKSENKFFSRKHEYTELHIRIFHTSKVCKTLEFMYFRNNKARR